MQLNTIEELLEDIRQGKPVILMDDEDRENEGDLIIAAEKITPEWVNFMVREARGLLCLTLTPERCDFLGLPPMVGDHANGSGYGTPFTVSIEAARGVTTGISAQDRAVTILAAVNPMGKPEDIVQPGHIFPLRAQPGGVLSRAGHTEAGCDLAGMAGLIPAAAIIEIMNEDGSMARRPDLETFAKTHNLKIGTIADLIHYRMLNETTVKRVEKRTVDTDFGSFEMNVFTDSISGGTHIAMSKGEIKASSPTLVRVHGVEPMRDLLAAHNGDNLSWSVQGALAKIAEEGAGVLVLLDSNQPLNLQRALINFYESSARHDGVSGTYYSIGTGSQILRELGVGKMRLLSSPLRFAALSGFELEVVEYLPFGDN